MPTRRCATLHELRGRRINVGPVQGARANTAATLYERLFDAPLPRSAASFLPQREALSALLADDDTLDAVVLVGPPASDAWRGVAAAAVGGDRLRVLPVDRTHPSTARALRTFVPAALNGDAAQANGAGAPELLTLGALGFLVVSGPDDDDGTLRDFARALCRALPALRGERGSAWNGVDLELDADAGWPRLAAVEHELRDCRGDDSSPADRPPAAASNAAFVQPSSTGDSR